MPNSIPRGYRNNNPGNIIRTQIPWLGKVPHADSTDTHFEQFTSLSFGIRAMIIDIRSDIIHKNQDTVEKLINSYAPPSENNTKAYVAHVAAALGVSPTEKIVATRDTLARLAMAISGHENGRGLTAAEVEAGMKLVVAQTVPVVKKKE